MKEKIIESTDGLDNLLIDFILNIMLISDTKLKEEERKRVKNQIRVLAVPLAKKDNIRTIPMTTYYSKNNINEIKEIEECIDEIKSESKLLKDLDVFKEVGNELAKGCHVTDRGEKKFMVQCMMQGKTANYFDIVQYFLDKIKDEENTIIEMVERLKKKDSLKDNRTVFMEEYVHHFLDKYKLPSSEVLIELSAQRYEGSESEAGIEFCDNQTNETRIIYKFDEINLQKRKLESANLRTIRKLMEMCKRKEFNLLADSEKQIIGLVENKKEDENKKTVKKYIRFNGFMDWSILIDGKERICYKRGRFFINSTDSEDIYAMKVQDFRTEYLDAKKYIDGDTMYVIERLVQILKHQKHGTAVILTNDVEEVERLCKAYRGILIQKGKLENEFDSKRLLSLTEIDGALFMNLNGECLACGIIVDGAAVGIGNPGRGARYNCINSYIEGKKEKEDKYIALIFSEDGGVDFICNYNDGILAGS